MSDFISFAIFAKFAKNGWKSFAFREKSKTQKYSHSSTKTNTKYIFNKQWFNWFNHPWLCLNKTTIMWLKISLYWITCNFSSFLSFGSVCFQPLWFSVTIQWKTMIFRQWKTLCWLSYLQNILSTSCFLPWSYQENQLFELILFVSWRTFSILIDFYVII